MGLDRNLLAPADQLSDGGCGKKLGIGGVAPVQQALALPQALWAVLEKGIEGNLQKGSEKMFNLEGDKSFFSLSSSSGILALVQLLAECLQPDHFLEAHQH